jgi:carbon storage regulator
MLVLTRRSGEGIVIGDEIQIRVLAIDGDRVRLGIDAPQQVSVYREEIYLQIKEENQKAQVAGNVDWEELKKIFSRP